MDGFLPLSRANFILDFIASGVIGTGDTETDDDDSSNHKQGGNSAELAVQAGQKSENFQWSFGTSISRDFEATTNDDDDGKTKDDAHNTYTFIGAILTKLAESSFLSSGERT